MSELNSYATLKGGIFLQLFYVKRPFNSALFAEAANRDAKVESRVIVHYIYDENGKYMDKTEPLEFNIKFKHFTVDYITKLSWISNAKYI